MLLLLLLLSWQPMSGTPKLCVSGQAVDTFQLSPEYSSLLARFCTMAVVSSLYYFILLTTTTTNVDVSVYSTCNIPSSESPKHYLDAKAIQKQPPFTFCLSKSVFKSHQLLRVEGKKVPFLRTKLVKAAKVNKASCCTEEMIHTLNPCVCVCVCIQNSALC